MLIDPADLPLLGRLWQILVHYKSTFTPMVYIPAFDNNFRLLFRDFWTCKDFQIGLLGRHPIFPFFNPLFRERHCNQSLHYLYESVLLVCLELIFGLISCDHISDFTRRKGQLRQR
jgi:hypothetical protein